MKFVNRILIYALMTFTTQVYAQNSKYMGSSARSMEKPAPYLDSARNVMLKNPSLAFQYIEKALIIANNNNDKFSEATCYQLMASINKSLGQYDLCILYLKKAENIYTQINNTAQLNIVYMQLGDAYLAEKNYTQSIEYYKLYQKYIDKRGTAAQQAEIKNKLAQAYTQSGAHDKAIDEYSEVLEYENERQNSSGAAQAQNKIGMSYQKSNQKAKALNAYKKSEEIAEKSGNKDELVTSLKNQGEVLRSDKKLDEELKVQNKIVDIGERTADKPLAAQGNLEIGNIYVEKKETEKALPYIQKSIKLAEETGNLEQKGKALKSLSEAYSTNANYDKALAIYHEYVDIKEALYKQKEEEIRQSYSTLADVSRQIQRLDLIEKEFRISEQKVTLLQQEQDVNKKSLRAQKILSISMIVALTVFILASLFIFRSNLQKRRANQMLALKSLRSQMNPHFIYNALNSVNNYISKSDEKSANKFLSDFSRLMRSVMDNSKHDFVTLASEIQIIEVYLKLENSRFADKFEYCFHVDSELETEQLLIPPMLIQPFIENAIWHGLRYRETKGFLSVKINQGENCVLVHIDDNGIGRKKSEELKTKNQKEHVSTGLKNIDNRIEIINQLYHTKIGLTISDIESEKETGTEVTLTIPAKK